MARKPINLAPKSIRKPSGLKKDGTPNIHWINFEKKLRNFEQVPLQDWTEVEILGYLFKRYSDHYDMDFTLSYSGPPTKCSEMYCIRRMLTTIGTQKGWIAKDYIDWVFNTQIIPKKVNITSLGFFFTRKFCQQFRRIFREKNKISRTTVLPPDYISLVHNLNLDHIETYGDLAFAQMAIKNEPDRDDTETYSRLFQQLNDLGLNEEILNNLED